MDRLRILHVLEYVEMWGNGVINAAVDLSCAQAALGEVVAVASAGGRYETLLRDNGVSHFRMAAPDKPKRLLRSTTDLRRIIADFKPSVVHCHTVSAVVLARALRPLYRYRLVSHLHNVHNPSSILMGLADRVIAVSDAVSKDLIRRGISGSRISTIPNHFVGSLRRQSIAQTRDLKLSQPAIVCVAGLNPRKNIDGLIAAFQITAERFPEAHLYIVGHGPDRTVLEDQAASTAVANRIHFEGFQEDAQAYMKAAYLFVLASHRESWGMVLQEAREVGAAIVATDVDGIPEALDFGRAGLLVPPGDIEALVNGINTVLDDPRQHQRLKSAAQAGLEDQTIWRMGEQVLNVYRSLLH